MNLNETLWHFLKLIWLKSNGKVFENFDHLIGHPCPKNLHPKTYNNKNIIYVYSASKTDNQ